MRISNQFNRLRNLRAVYALLLVCFSLVTISSQRTHALEVDITGGVVEPLPIAVETFLASGNEAKYGVDISRVIADNLASSGLFRPINQASFLTKTDNFDAVPQFANWRVIKAQALVNGRISRQQDGRLKAEFRLWDVFAGRQLAGQQFFSSTKNWRRIAHVISDSIYQQLTGEKGYFDTRVVFIDETGPKSKRRKRLAIMDQDGANLKYLTDGSDLVLTPRFSPTNQEITYVSFGRDFNPKVYLLNIESGQREVVGNFPGMTFAPRFSPDGRKVIMSLQSGGNSNIYTMDLQSRRTTRLTNTPAIDTAPSYSPDGRYIAFESDRGGSQQIYVMRSDGSDQKRISFGQGVYSTPVWSPRGDYIAFTKQLGSKFLIGVMRVDGSQERILTEGFHNEGPTWAPNGRVLMFFRDSPGENGGPSLWAVNVSGYNERRVRSPSFGSDPAWSPLIN